MYGTCLVILELLVERKFLVRTGHGMYTRPTEGRAGRLPPQMARDGTEVIRQSIEEAV
jgi:hypothetical protein